MHMEKLSGKKIAKNMMLSVLAQAVSVLVGFVLNLIVPKFIPKSDYSLWQSYLPISGRSPLWPDGRYRPAVRPV